MLSFPRTRNEWTVAIASALAGFFAGGAAVAGVQKFLKKYFGIGVGGPRSRARKKG